MKTLLVALFAMASITAQANEVTNKEVEVKETNVLNVNMLSKRPYSEAKQEELVGEVETRKDKKHNANQINHLGKRPYMGTVE